jgi:hypothetical protein
VKWIMLILLCVTLAGCGESEKENEQQAREGHACIVSGTKPSNEKYRQECAEQEEREKNKHAKEKEVEKAKEELREETRIEDERG